MERYRSGHNEAVLKTVCPKGRVGSNPTLSAEAERLPVLTGNLEKYPSWPKGLPWKGSRSLVAARGFKSLLLRLILSQKLLESSGSFCMYNARLWVISNKDTRCCIRLKTLKKSKKWLTNDTENGNIVKLTRERQQRKIKKLKKFLTKRKGFDKISKLSQRENDRNLDN